MRLTPIIGSVGPNDTEGRLDALTLDVLEIARVLNQGLSFGAPISADASTAGDPVLDNIEGAWVTASFTALDTATTITHNLDIPTNAAGTPNVRWLVFGIEHDGTGATATSEISISFETGDTVAASTIELRAYTSGRTVGGGNPITVTMFFVRAES